MPSSRKGKGRKYIERRPVPIPISLAAKLRTAAGQRSDSDRLLLKADGTPWRPELAEQRWPFAAVATTVGLPKTTMYALRHSSIVRALLAGIPTQVVANHHDTSVGMITRNYGRFITDHSDSLVRGALLDPAQP